MENFDELVKAQNRSTVVLRAFLSLMQIYLIGSITVGLLIGTGVYFEASCLADEYGCEYGGTRGYPFLLIGGILAIALLFAAIAIINKAIKNTHVAEGNI
jgi:hypothetical protein